MAYRTRSALGLAVAALLASDVLQAQAALPDARWQALVGCWVPSTAPAEAAAMSANSSAQLPLLCIVPATGSAVRIATVDDGNVMLADTVDASGVRRSVTREGCTGWESAEFAANGRRVHYSSEFDCGGVRRASTGLISVTADGELLDVLGIASGAGKSVRVARYVDAGAPASLPPDIAAVVSGRGLIASAARTAAGAPLSEADIIEAARALDPVVMQAWLIERGDRFAFDAKALVRLAEAGVPGSVTDVLVALSNPRFFAITRTPLGTDVQQKGGPRAATSDGAGRRIYTDMYDAPYGFGLGMGRYTLYDRYGYYYGSTPYSGYGYGYGQYFYRPPVIVMQPGGGGSGGRAVKGRGYTRNRPTEATGRTAEPSTSGRAGSGSTPSTKGSSGSSSSSDGGRKAKPRP